MMELPVVCVLVCIPCSIILFLHAQNISPIEIHHQLTLVFGNIMTIQHTRKWCREFSKGRRDVHDAVRLGCPRASTKDTVNTIRALLDENRRLSIWQKQILGGQHFQNDEVKNFTTQYFSNFDATFYHTLMQKLVLHYDKCLNCLGDYVEK